MGRQGWSTDETFGHLAHGLAGEAVAGRADEDDRIVEERLEGDAAMATRRADDAELELARGDALDDRLRVEDPERDAQLRMPLRELAEELREDDPARTGGGADLEAARQLVASLERHLGHDLLLEREQALRAAVEPHAGLGRLDSAARAVEQLRPETLLERSDLQADGRLGDAEALGRLGEALLLDDGAERRELTRVHEDHL